MLKQRRYTRREFLKLAARVIGGVGLLGGGLGAFLGACGRRSETANTVATVPHSPTSSESSTTVAPTTSTAVSAAPEKGRALRIGVVTATSGPLAFFGKADAWWMSNIEAALPDGLLCGDNRLHPVRFLTWECRSRAELAREGATYLISEAGVDVLLCTGGLEVVNAVANESERLLCPCLANFVEWKGFALREGVPDRPLKFSYAHAFSVQHVMMAFIAVWEKVLTNRKVGVVVPDTPEGKFWTDEATGLGAEAAKKGYEVIMPEPYSLPCAEFSSYIEEFAKNGCEICCAVMPLPEFANFWRQAEKKKYRPKVVTVREALFSPHVGEALGSRALGLTGEALWLPDWPYSDFITGRTCRQLAEDYMRKIGDHWTPAIGAYARFEWAAQVWRTVKDIDSKREFLERLKETRAMTCLGTIDLSQAVTSDATSGQLTSGARPAETVYLAPVAAVQWTKAGRSDIRPVQVYAIGHPELAPSIPVQPMEYVT
ncbi:MAG: ABC transporter substrate-binding protein [Thermoleophilia bacterium]|nr:ABC transporter substrate-binding protein [Thermoleophilia bacterium]